MNEKEIQYNFFEKEIGNNIRYSPLNNSYYIRFQSNFSYNEKSLILKIKNEIFYLSKNIEIYRNGYLILKDQNSNSSMLYVGIFININYNNILYNLLKQFILKNEINEEIKPEDIIIELLINLSDVNKTMELYFKENNNKHKFKLIYSNKYNKILPLKFIFKGNIKENEFYFNIINDKIIENNFIKLIPISAKAKDYYLNFLINNN